MTKRGIIATGMGALALLLAAAPPTAAPQAPPRALHVAPSGADDAAGTAERPLRTIGRCAQLATPGDVCTIHAGTYRETLRPARSGTASAPISFVAAGGERPVLDATDPVDGWTAAGDGTWTAQIAVPPGLPAHELWIDGAPAPEGRLPDLGADALRPQTFVADAGTTATRICDDALAGHPAGELAGATLWILSGRGWWAHTTRVTSNGTGTPCADGVGFVTFEPLEQTGRNFDPKAGNDYALIGLRRFADAAGEWHVEGATGALTLRLPTGQSPAGRTTLKRRLDAIDLSARDHIAVRGLETRGGRVTTDSASEGVVLDRLRVRRPSRYRELGNGQFAHAADSGVVLAGDGNRLLNSEVSQSDGNGVSITGARHLVENVLIRDVNLLGTSNGGIRAPDRGGGRPNGVAQGPGIVIRRTTILRSGGGGILPRVTASTIERNEIAEFQALVNDVGGGIYAAVDDAGGSVIAHNRIRGNRQSPERSRRYAASETGGIYLDVGAGPWSIHHNVVTDMDAGRALVLAGDFPPGTRRHSRGNLVAHNTLAHPSGKSLDGGGIDDASGTRIVNNVFRATIETDSFPGAEIADNLTADVDPLLDDAFVPRAGSPALDAARLLPGVNELFAAAGPDIGAREAGAAAAPTAGCTCDERRGVFLPPEVERVTAAVRTPARAAVETTVSAAGAATLARLVARPASGPELVIGEVRVPEDGYRAPLRAEPGALTPGATYRLRVVASNDAGETSSPETLLRMPGARVPVGAVRIAIPRSKRVRVKRGAVPVRVTSKLSVPVRGRLRITLRRGRSRILLADRAVNVPARGSATTRLRVSRRAAAALRSAPRGLAAGVRLRALDGYTRPVALARSGRVVSAGRG